MSLNISGSGIMAAIGNAFGAIKEFFGWANTRAQEKNAPAVVAAKVSQEQTKVESSVNQEVANGDIEKQRDDFQE